METKYFPAHSTNTIMSVSLELPNAVINSSCEVNIFVSREVSSRIKAWRNPTSNPFYDLSKSATETRINDSRLLLNKRAVMSQIYSIFTSWSALRISSASMDATLIIDNYTLIDTLLIIEQLYLNNPNLKI